MLNGYKQHLKELNIVRGHTLPAKLNAIQKAIKLFRCRVETDGCLISCRLLVLTIGGLLFKLFQIYNYCKYLNLLFYSGKVPWS